MQGLSIWIHVTLRRRHVPGRFRLQMWRDGLQDADVVTDYHLRDIQCIEVDGKPGPMSIQGFQNYCHGLSQDKPNPDMFGWWTIKGTGVGETAWTDELSLYALRTDGDKFGVTGQENKECPNPKTMKRLLSHFLLEDLRNNRSL